MASRVYPTNAARGGAATLTGAGSANDVFTFASEVQPVVQNNTAAIIYVAAGMGTASAGATQGDEAIAANGGRLALLEEAEWVAVYGAATTKVNGTATLGIVLYGVGD